MCTQPRETPNNTLMFGLFPALHSPFCFGHRNCCLFLLKLMERWQLVCTERNHASREWDKDNKRVTPQNYNFNLKGNALSKAALSNKNEISPTNNTTVDRTSAFISHQCLDGCFLLAQHGFYKLQHVCTSRRVNKAADVQSIQFKGSAHTVFYIDM